MAENKENTSVFISGTKVRAQLVEGESPDPRIMRETTAAILVEYYKSKAE
jgi:ATP sulfurylase